MYKLIDLIKGFNYETVRGVADRDISEVVYDSRKICEGCLFICIEGNNFDGHSAVMDAVDKKAAALLVRKDVDVDPSSDVTVIKVEDTS